MEKTTQQSVQEELVRMAQEEARDATQFEKIFEVPAKLTPNNQDQYDKAAQKIKETKVRAKLVTLANDLATKEKELEDFKKTSNPLGFNEQVTKAQRMKEELDILGKEFIKANKLADRFDCTPVETGPSDTHYWQSVLEILKTRGCF